MSTSTANGPLKRTKYEPTTPNDVKRPKNRMTEQLKFCMNIVKDLLHKKNMVKTLRLDADHLHVFSLSALRLALCKTCRREKSESFRLLSDREKADGFGHSQGKCKRFVSSLDSNPRSLSPSEKIGKSRIRDARRVRNGRPIDLQQLLFVQRPSHRCRGDVQKSRGLSIDGGKSVHVIVVFLLQQLFEDRYAKLPDEPAVKSNEIDFFPSASRNNGHGTTSASSGRKRKRPSSKHNSSAGGQTSSMISSSDDEVSSGESSDNLESSREDTVRQLRALQDQVKSIESTLTYLIQRTNDRLALRQKNRTKRGKGKNLDASSFMPMLSSDPHPNPFSLLSPIDPTFPSSSASNIFNSMQMGHSSSQPPPFPAQATRNPSIGAPMATKKSTPSLASLLTSGTSNGPSQLNNSTPLDNYQFENLSPTKPSKASKSSAAKTNAGKGSEQARRGTAATAGPKR